MVAQINKFFIRNRNKNVVKRKTKLAFVCAQCYHLIQQNKNR